MSFVPGKHLEPTTISMGDILKGSYFEVPINQRDYEWTEAQRGKLWTDLESAVQHDCYEAPKKPMGHFLGAIVVVGSDRPHDEDRWKIIDGQQRLTTFTILIDCLRTYVEDMSNKREAKRLLRGLEDCLKGTSSSEPPRLMLNRYNDFYLGSLIENDAWEDKERFWEKNFNKKYSVHRNIKDAYFSFREKIGVYLDSRNGDRDDNLRDLVDVTLDNLYALRVRTENFKMAYRLFETLNARGLDLSQADLIKNELIKYAERRGEGITVADIWPGIVDAYEEQPKEKIDLPQFVQFSYSYRYKKINHEDTYEKISESLKEGEHDPVELVKEFRKDADNWISFIFGDLSRWTDELESSQEAILNTLWKQHCVPFVMAAMNRFNGDVDSLEMCMRLTEHYLFRQGMVCRDSVEVLQKFFSKVGNMLHNRSTLEDVREEFKKNSPDPNFKEQFKSYSVKNMKQGFYVLWKIEYYLHQDLEVGPRSQSAAQHLEHIMPKKPGPEWGGIENMEGFSSYLNRVGNLLILKSSINQFIRNSSIEFKLKNHDGKAYINSAMHLPHEVYNNYQEWADNGRWGFESINKRQAYLAENYALQVWSL